MFKNSGSTGLAHYHQLHKLDDILVITVLAIICGADGWVDVEEFGKAKEEWLKDLLELLNGIPPHDTFSRVFAIMDGEQLQKSFSIGFSHL